LEDLKTIVTGCIGGDQAAFAQLVSRYQDTAVGYGFSLLGDFHLAQDAAQEAFLQAYRDLPSLTEPMAFPGWFRKIVFKYCDRIKRRKPRPSVSLAEAPEIADYGANPAEVFAVSQFSSIRDAKIATALQSLSETDRSVITLFYMGEHSIETIGAFLQLSQSAVKKRLQRARERLKERMLEMLVESLSENAPSKNARFAEAANLLHRATQALEQDPRIEATWLADPFGLADDTGWSSAWLQVVVKDDDIDSCILGRREQASILGTPLLIVEAPQNAPKGGAYLGTFYDGEAGPYEINWYWQPRTGAVIPQAVTIPSGETRPVTRVLFNKAGLPTPDGLVLHSDYNGDIPAVLKTQMDARSEVESMRDDALNCMNLFWGMLLISARWAAAIPSEPEPRHLEFIGNLLSKVQTFAAVPVEFPASRSYNGAASKVAMLRDVAHAMEKATPAADTRGVAVNPAVPGRVHRFLDMIATS